MNAVSMNNLWTYLQGLSLTADNWNWLATKISEISGREKAASAAKAKRQ